MTGSRSKSLIIAISIASLCSSFGCGNYAPPELPPIDYYLVITDSIGAEVGDSNYVFNWPGDAAYSPDGEIAVADKMRHEVLFYTVDGEFICSIGSQGEGPGAFIRPYGIDFYSDGSFLVTCRNGISLYNSEYEYQDRMKWPLLGPHVVTALDAGGFVGTSRAFDVDEQRIMATSTLGLWKEVGDPYIEYHSIEYVWEIPDKVIDMSANRENGILACASRKGRVFFTRMSIDRFEIAGLESDGTEFFHVIDDNFCRTRKTDEELHDEMEDLESLRNRVRGVPFEMEVRLDPFKQAISFMFLEGNERLWVWLGSYPGIVFRVYGMDGEVLFHAMVDYHGDILDLRNWVMKIDEYGCLMFPTNPQDTPRIYMLELVEAD